MDVLYCSGTPCGRSQWDIQWWFLVVVDGQGRGRTGRGNERPGRDPPIISDLRIFQSFAAGSGATPQRLERDASSQNLGQTFDDDLAVAVDDCAEAFDSLD